MIKSWGLYVVASALVIGYTQCENGITISILPSSKVIFRQVNDDLNLTCIVRFQDKKLENDVTLSWSLPVKQTSGSDRINISKKENELTVNIRKLQKSDSGVYICEVRSEQVILKQKVQVLVTSGHKGKCLDSFFSCGRDLCIPMRYACDGYADCPGGEDEISATCGKDPCEGKILCDDRRCISKHLCCDREVDPDCPVVYLMPCCRKFLREGTDSSISPLQRHHYSDVSFLQSTIYTIVSCAIAFIFITTIMVVAICRIHMQRSVMSLHPSRLPRPVDRRCLWAWPWFQSRIEQARHRRDMAWEANLENADIESEANLCHRTSLSSYPCHLSSHDRFVVMCKNVAGVQLVECLPKPPPYSESIPSASTEPPPPYSEGLLSHTHAVEETPSNSSGNEGPHNLNGVRQPQ